MAGKQLPASVRSIANFSLGGQESASKPPQTICKTLAAILEQIICEKLDLENMNLEFKLEKFSEDDFPKYFQLVNNEKVMEMITERRIEFDEAKNDFEKLIANNSLDENFGNYKIIDTENEEFLGLAKLEIKNKSSKEAEIGYMILPKYWGKGIAGKVGKQLIEKAKTQKSIDSIFAIIDPKNLASRKILTNNGFVSKEFKDFDGLPGEILELKPIDKNNYNLALAPC